MPSNSNPGTPIHHEKLVISSLNMRRQESVAWEDLVRDFKLAELADALEKQTLLNPVTVRPSDEQPGMFEVLAGQRRTLAFEYLRRKYPGDARWSSVPCYVMHVSKEEGALISLSENLQREDVDPFARAAAVQDVMQKFGLTQRDVSKRLGKSEAVVSEYLAVLRLVPSVQARVRAGDIGRRAAVDLAQSFTEPSWQEMAADVVAGLSHQEAVRSLAVLKKHPEWFSLTKTELRARVAAEATGVPAELRSRIVATLRQLDLPESTINFGKLTREEAMRTLEVYEGVLVRRRASAQPLHVAAPTRALPKPVVSTAFEGVFPDDYYVIPKGEARGAPVLVEEESEDAAWLVENIVSCDVVFRIKVGDKVREVRVPLQEATMDEAERLALIHQAAERVRKRAEARQ